MEGILEDFATRPDTRLQSLFLTQRLPAGLAFIAGSASEPPASVITQGAETHLRWDWDPVQNTEPHTVTYTVRPLAEGVHPIEGAMRVVDKARGEREIPMPSRPITVSGLCLPPTPTDIPTDIPTPTPIPTATDIPPAPTATHTATTPSTATVTATSTATATPAALYLPLLLREKCIPDIRRVDVVLAIDASSSMSERTAAGGTKLEAAKEAARAFLGELRFDRGDQAAIVVFNSGATLLAPLTGDRAALESALAGVQTAQQTCLVCAVDAAGAELGSARHAPDHAAVLVLLTDGRSNPQPASEAVARAAAAKAAGVVVFTIGLGADVEAGALAAIASRPGWYYAAPEAGALAEIYREIAVALPCSAGAFWGGR